MQFRAVVVASFTLAFIGLTNSAAAQRVPAFGGVEARVGLVSPERASLAAAVMGEVDLGYVWRPELRLIAGLSHFRANIDREPGDDEGSFGATGFWLSGRYDLHAARTLSAYVRTSMVVHRVDADAWDSDVDALLSGTNAGAAVAIGARRVLDDRGRLSGTIELRRTQVNNIANTALEIGVRLLQRGTLSYVAEGVALAPAPLFEPRDAGPPVETVDQQAPMQAPAVVDTAAARRQAEADRAANAVAEADAAARAAELADRQASEAAIAEQRDAEAAAARVAAAESMLRQGLDRAAAAMASAVSLRETATAFVVTIGGNAFPSGAAVLSAAARGELRVLATVLAGYPGHIVTVEGHTDAVGDAAANVALSIERAAAVRAGLIVEGVDPLWTGVRGHGSARSVASNETAAGRAANRRVEIHVARFPCSVPPRPGPDGGLVCPDGTAGP